MAEITEQIDEMLKFYESENEQVVDEQTDDEQVDSTEDETPNNDEQETEQPEQSETLKAPEPEPEPEDELTRLKREQFELKSRLDEMLNKQQPIKEQPVEELIEELDFVEGLDLEDIVTDNKEFNKLLNKVFKKGIEVARKETLSKVPTIVRENVVSIKQLQEATDKFYKENSDLQPFKGAVATVFNELAAVNPSLDYNQLLTKTEEETRKRLNLFKKPVTKSDDKKDVPRLPKKKSQTRQLPDNKPLDPLLADIDTMNEVLSRR